MSLFHKTYKISVCIPVYGTEKVLSKCLESVEMQTFIKNYPDSLEIIVVDDYSPENSAKTIVKQFSRESKLPANFIRHDYNKGLVEVRRTAVYAAKGKYIFILDSDDTLPPEALEKLYEKAEDSGADIVQGKASVGDVYEGELYNHPDKNEILDGFLLQNNHAGFLWGKLFLRETYLNALNHIPPLECTMAEDFIQYIWLCYEAKKYAGISEVVYNYSTSTGISSHSVIDNLERWEKVCSVAGVFTSLYQDFENPEISFTEEEKDSIRKKCIYYVHNNLKQWEKVVAPDVKAEAYQMLCDYWGEALVRKISAIK